MNVASHTAQNVLATGEFVVNVVPFDKRASTPVQWRKNGDAYCPEGFVLRSVPVKYY